MLWPLGALDGMVGGMGCDGYWTMFGLYCGACMIGGAPFMCAADTYCGCACTAAPSKCWMEGNDIEAAPGGEAR